MQAQRGHITKAKGVGKCIIYIDFYASYQLFFIYQLLGLIASDNMAFVYCTEIKHKLFEQWSI